MIAPDLDQRRKRKGAKERKHVAAQLTAESYQSYKKVLETYT